MLSGLKHFSSINFILYTLLTLTLIYVLLNVLKFINIDYELFMPYIYFYISLFIIYLILPKSSGLMFN